MVLVKKILQMRVSLARIYSTSKSNLNIAKLRGKLEAQGLPSNQAKAIMSACVKSMEDRMNILANSHARKVDLEKMKTLKEVELSTCKFELQMLREQHLALMKCWFRNSRRISNDQLEIINVSTERLFNESKEMLLSLLAYMRFYMMMYAITFFSIMTVHAAFIRKFAVEDSLDDDDLVEPISPF